MRAKGERHSDRELQREEEGKGTGEGEGETQQLGSTRGRTPGATAHTATKKQ